MILLNMSISFSVAIMPFLYLLAIITGFLLVAVINILLSNILDNSTKYKYDIDSFNKKQYLIFLWCGFIIVPLFKSTIKDARCVKDINYQLNYFSSISLERRIKLIKLKYKKKNFVVRKIFHIFVSK